MDRGEQIEEDPDGQQNDNADEIAGSPGSNSNSSSSNRQQRIVHLIQDNDCGPRNWTLRPEFYEIDVGQNSDDSVESYDIDELLEPYIEEVHGRAGENLNELDDDSPAEDDEVLDDERYFVPLPDAILELDEPEYVIEPYDDDQSSTDSDPDQDQDQAANYDTTLPVSHRYLGDNLEESRGRRVLVEGSTTNLTIINLVPVVLFPGQVLPITTANLSPRITSCLKNCIASGLTIVGILSDPRISAIGTTAEIRNYSIEEDELKLIVEGRQRFRLLSAPSGIAYHGLIMILPEVTLGRPYSCISSPLLRFYTTDDVPSKFIISKHPHWVLKRYEAKKVMSRILEQIKDWCSADLPKDPNDFSYWVSSNLPISNSERLEALSFSCTEARLLWLVAMLERFNVFGCSACRNVICSKKDAFSMSQGGPQCSFVNPSGYFHDTLTVRNTTGLIQEYGWTKEYTWFPGYAWRMANCDSCNRHIGWCYKSTDSAIKPKRFFGLSRANVRLQTA